MSDDLTPRMLWNAAQREGDKGTDGSDLTFTRLLWMAQILAAIEVAEAATRAVRAEAAIARVREVYYGPVGLLDTRIQQIGDILRALDGDGDA